MTFTSSPILNILIMILIALAIIVGFNLANIYYLKKLNVNKWLLLGIAIVTFVIAFALSSAYPNTWWQLIPLVISLSCFMWFIEVRRRKDKSPKDSKKVVMKAKAKPNRAKKPDTTANANKQDNVKKGK
ncbi:MAG: hypothetical protein QMB63_04730 [Clostridiaceae bacterium]